MFAVLNKAALSPIIDEVLDVGTGITDARGNLVRSGAGVPTFIGVLDKAVHRIIELHGQPEPLSFASGLKLGPGDEILIETANGGNCRRIR